MENKNKNLYFGDTEVAFHNKSNTSLRRAYTLFKVMNNTTMMAIAEPLTKFVLAIHLPISWAIRGTIYKQFCGGETIEECSKAIDYLGKDGIGSILDYSVEGEESEKAFDATAEEIIRTIEFAAKNKHVPFSVFKATGVGRFDLWAKVSAHKELTEAEKAEFERVKNRIDKMCAKAAELNVPLLVDAEETWIQEAIDNITLDMMRKYNRQRPLILNTYQMYITYTLDHIKKHHQIAQSEGFFFGCKIVRGAYMEKERERADEKHYPSPIWPDKPATDKAYNDAIDYCTQYHDSMTLIVATHNEESCQRLVNVFHEKNLPHDYPNLFFAQLYGMSDNLSYVLSTNGFNVVKYVPYGGVRSLMPYLFRRAKENTAMRGQSSRELELIRREIHRRKLK